MRTCYTHIRTDHRAAILGLSIYRSRCKATNIDPPRWALQIHVDLLVQGYPVSRSSVEGVNIIVIQTLTGLADGCIVTLCYTVDAVGASGIYYTNCRSLSVIA